MFVLGTPVGITLVFQSIEELTDVVRGLEKFAALAKADGRTPPLQFNIWAPGTTREQVAKQLVLFHKATEGNDELLAFLGAKWSDDVEMHDVSAPAFSEPEATH